ncbi:MAG: hypothetical protein AB7O67_12715 [Vicinamibacterales bacterium]
MSDTHDLEYGPTPPGAEYEHTDIEPGIGYRFAIWLAVAMILSAGLVYGIFWYFERAERAADQAAQVFPLAAGRPTTPPAPRLQNQPFKDVYLLKQHEREVLSSYAWVDKDNGIVRIPITEAMRLLEARSLPARAAGSDGAGRVVADSSAGRTSVTR